MYICVSIVIITIIIVAIIASIVIILNYLDIGSHLGPKYVYSRSSTFSRQHGIFSHVFWLSHGFKTNCPKIQ